MIARRLWVFALVLAAATLLQASLHADSPRPRKLVVIVANQLTLDHLTQRPPPYIIPPPALGENAVGMVSANDPLLRERTLKRPFPREKFHVGDVLGFDLPNSVLVLSSVVPDRDVPKIARSLASVDAVVVDVWNFDSYNAQGPPTRALLTMVSRLTGLEPYRPVVVVVSFVPPHGREGKELTPILVSGLGDGVLMSWSTRTPGLIAATDIQPTLENIIGRSGKASTGRPAYVVPAGDKWKLVRELFERTQTTRGLLIPVLIALAVIAVPVVTVVAIALGTGRRVRPKLAVLLQILLLVCALAPLSMLLFWPTADASTFRIVYELICQTLAAAGVVSLIPVVIRGARRPGVLPILTVNALTALVLLVDALTGANLCKWSILSNYQIDGFRFYGIGNEYGSIFIVMAGIALSVAASWNRERVGRLSVVLVGLLGLVFSAILGMGWFGANFGACLACAATFFLITVSLARGKFGFWHVVAGFVIGAALSGGLALLDAAVSGSHASHAARAVAGGGSSAFQHLSQIAMRKALMGLRIVFSHYAVIGVLPFAPFLWLWMKKIQPLVREFLSDKPILSSCLKAILAGSVIAFLTNDSGIVMVAFMIGMTMLFLLYCLWERVESGERRVESSNTPSR